MYIKELSVKDFRNLKTQKVYLSEGLNLLVGDNGQGKTNFLEAIHLIATLKSFRTSTLRDIVALDKKESGIILTEDELNIILFYTVKTLLTAFDNRSLENHVTNLLSKLYHKRFLKESDQNLELIGQKMDFECHFEICTS